MKRPFFYFLTAVITLFSIQVTAQNIAINEDGSAPNANAILDVKSFNKGVLIPRVSTSGRLSIPDTKGLLVYDTTTSSFWYNTGTAWQNIAAAPTTAATSWLLTGNTIIDTSFLGTINDKPLKIKVFNQPSGLINRISRNAFWGYSAGASNTTGYNNVAIGHEALQSNVSGTYNTASGFRSLWVNTTGEGNTSNGAYSLSSNTTGYYNSGSGYYALQYNTTGSRNIGIGAYALENNITGNNNISIGISADNSATNLNNATAIGFAAIVNASNKVRFGNSAVTSIEGAVSFSTPSDGRFKYKVQEDVKGLDFILQLRPVTYQFDAAKFDELLRPVNNTGDSITHIKPDYSEATAIRRSGFIAQEVEKAATASGYDFSGLMKPKTKQDHYSVSYESFVVPLVKAVQEQQQLIAGQQQLIADLQKQMAALKQLLQDLK